MLGFLVVGEGGGSQGLLWAAGASVLLARVWREASDDQLRQEAGSSVSRPLEVDLMWLRPVQRTCTDTVQLPASYKEGSLIA